MPLSDADPTDALLRASTTLAAIRSRRLHVRGRSLFGARRWWIFGRSYEYLWPFADTWSALCTLGSLPDQSGALELLDTMVRGLRAYSREPEILDEAGSAGFESVVTPPLGGGGDRFYDDNAWLGLALVRHHELTGDPVLLRLAERVFSFVVSGWSTEASWQIPGGHPLEGAGKQPLPQHLRERTDRGTGGAAPRADRGRDLPGLGVAHVRVDATGPAGP